MMESPNDSFKYSSRAFATMTAGCIGIDSDPFDLRDWVIGAWCCGFIHSPGEGFGLQEHSGFPGSEGRGGARRGRRKASEWQEDDSDGQRGGRDEEEHEVSLQVDFLDLLPLHGLCGSGVLHPATLVHSGSGYPFHLFISSGEVSRVFEGRVPFVGHLLFAGFAFRIQVQGFGSGLSRLVLGCVLLHAGQRDCH
ncbi:hypothetical protein OJ253_737 [Cryptosporidium canis]|uniref:Uncharacterized protein n=1 Tax=Cryptosporidium canis TaxID=195482 RepID=A0A9D5HYD5_9CRYT|nr:hypothetical protein OJ253_737 [Cryptosporidium canis]